MEKVFYKGIDEEKQLIDETLPRAIVSNIYKMADDLAYSLDIGISPPFHCPGHVIINVFE